MTTAEQAVAQVMLRHFFRLRNKYSDELRDYYRNGARKYLAQLKEHRCRMNG